MKNYQHYARNFAVMAVIASVVLLGVMAYFRERISLYSQLPHTQAAPYPKCRTFLKTSVPDAWSLQEFGVVQMRLPDDLAEASQAPLRHGGGTLVRAAGFEVIIDPSEESNPDLDPELTRAEAILDDGIELTWPALIYRVYQTYPIDLSWTMTAKEVRWRRYCLEQPIGEFDFVENYVRADLDAILLIRSKYAVFRWQSKQLPYEGSIRFASTDSPLDMAKVRAICESLQIHEQQPQAANSRIDAQDAIIP